MSILSSYKKIFLLGFILVILIAIPFSVYIAQKRQNITSKADASTSLSFEPASTSTTPVTTEVGKTLTLNVVLDPKTGVEKGLNPNQVSFVKLSISFDPAKFSADSLKPNTDSPNTLTSVLEDAVLTASKATISLSIGANPANVVTTKTKIAILRLKALSTTDANNTTKVEFDSVPNTQVLSIASSDQTSENVLSTTIPATVTINSSTITTPTPAPSGGSSLTPTPTPASVSFPQTPLLQGGTGGTGLSTGSAVFNPAPVFETQPTPIVLLPQQPLPPTGPGENILGVGIVGIIFTIIGGALFILL